MRSLRVAFGTSGHRGSAFAASFNEAHILAIAQAVCLDRRHAGIEGPLFLGMDTHALSELAFASALEVLAANGVETMIDAQGGYTLTPVISHAILSYNRGRTHRLTDGIVISPSHKPAATLVNDAVDPMFRFMSVDWDGKIRMDCSSPYAMTTMIGLRDKFDIAFANDTDSDPHGIISPSGGLMNPNQFLAAAICYLCENRPEWRRDSAVGKTVVSSGMIDRVAAKLGRRLIEAPVGFKWFSNGLMDGSPAFGGEESAGASFLRRNGSVWTTDKDGLIMGLLAAEMTARAGRDPYQFYAFATHDLGESFCQRMDSPATREQKELLSNLDPSIFEAKELAGEPIEAKLNRAPGNNKAIGGIKVVAKNGWFAARPSGTDMSIRSTRKASAARTTCIRFKTTRKPSSAVFSTIYEFLSSDCSAGTELARGILDRTIAGFSA